MSRRRRAAPGAPEGGLVVDKPPGMTSHDVVAVARRALGQPRIGHTGTLDPMATGVLVLLLGRATRLAQYLAADAKTYRADVRFGFATDTYDAEGVPLHADSSGAEPPLLDSLGVPPGTSGRASGAASRISAAALEGALARFRGRHLQVPPPVSAKKVGGRRAYELARTDTGLALPPVEVEVFDLRLLELRDDVATLVVTCSAGFYVRSLAHALGVELGTGAHLSALRRERAGGFSLDRALGLDVLTGAPGDAARHVIPMASLLPGMASVQVSEAGRRRIQHGQAVPASDVVAGAAASLEISDLVRVVDESGALVALGRTGPAALHPVLVLM